MNENSTEVTGEIQKVDFTGSTPYKIGQNLLTLPLQKKKKIILFNCIIQLLYGLM